MIVTPKWLSDFVEEHGADIIRQNLGERRIRQMYGLNFYQSKEAAAYLKRHAQKIVPQGDQPAYRSLGKTHLVIGDAHARPDQDLSRFTWLGRMVAEIKPDVIISIGDWADMPSLSHYDKGHKSFEGRRYLKDIEAANKALELFHKELPGCYHPKLVQITGNHENRINRTCENNAVYDGLLSTGSLDFEDAGWEVVPFLHYKEIDGIIYSHYFTAGNTDRPISGEFAAAALVRKQLKSCVAGHSHLFDYARRTDARGNRVNGLVVGCYTDAYETYAGPSNAIWWRGICVLRNVNNGDYDLETHSIGAIQERWG